MDNEAALGSLAGIVHGFIRVAQQRIKQGDVAGASRALALLADNFQNPPAASPVYIDARRYRENAIFDIECGRDEPDVSDQQTPTTY